MADKVTSPVVVLGTPGPQLTPPKKVSKAKKPRAKSTHPRTAEMVNSAIAVLKERGGSSLQAIKKYIANTYKVDPEKLGPFIKKYLKAAVVSGSLVQTKGKGAAGSFKLSVKSEGTKTINKPITGAKKAVVKKPSPAKKIAVTKPAPKKAPTAEKRNVAKKPAAKPPKAKTTKSKSVAASPKKAQPKKRPTVTKVKKPVPKKVTSLKKK